MRLLLFVAALLGAVPASAQALDPVHKANENGLRVGDGRMHPFLEVVSGYDSNVALVSENQTGDLVVYLKPGLTLDVPSNAVSLALAGNVNFQLYTGALVDAPEGFHPSQLNQVLADANAGLTFNPQGAVLVHLGGHYVRTDQTVLQLSTLAINNVVEGQLTLGIQPGGKALVIEPGYSIAYQKLEPTSIELQGTCTAGNPTCDPSQANLFNRLGNTIHLDGRWRFLPKTALVFNGALTDAHYFNTPVNDSDNLKLLAGLQGLLTTKLSVVAKGGFGTQFGTGDFRSFVAQLEAGFLFSEQAQTHLGYLRTFEPAPVAGNNYLDDKLYWDGRAFVGGRLALHGAVSYDFITFSSGQDDQLLHVDLGPDVQVTDWFTAGVVVAYSRRTSTGADIQVAAGNFGTAPTFDYQRTEVGVRLVAIY